MATLTSKTEARQWLEEVCEGAVYKMALADFHNKRENCELEGDDRIEFLRQLADDNVNICATPSLIALWKLCRPDIVEFIVEAQQEFHDVRITNTARAFLVAGLQMHVWIDKHYEDEIKTQIQFPEIKEEHRAFLDRCSSMAQRDCILHAIYRYCKDWNVEYGMSRNWLILYKVLEKLNLFTYYERVKYKKFTESIVFYVKPDVNVGKLSNSLSTVRGLESRDSYPKEEAKIYDDLYESIKIAKNSSK